MKKYAILACILLFFLFGSPIASSIAQPKSFKEGIYKMQDLNLSSNINYILQNISPNEYVFVIVFDGNQVVQQLIQLPPLSDEYSLTPILPGYVMIIVGKGDVIINEA